tara:strand:+ start:114 stop:584 length:471 start_codon:yes stop_codon:yes gene_type:complete
MRKMILALVLMACFSGGVQGGDDRKVKVSIRLPKSKDAERYGAFTNWLSSFPNRMIDTNEVATVSPPIATNDWGDSRLEGVVISNGWVVAVTNVVQVEDPDESLSHKEKRVLSEIMTGEVNAKLVLDQIRVQDAITRKERILRDVLSGSKDTDFDD